jgi:hypothetical protein
MVVWAGSRMFPSVEGACAVCREPIPEGRTFTCSDRCGKLRHYCHPVYRFLHATEDPVEEWRPWLAAEVGMPEDSPLLEKVAVKLARLDKLNVYLSREKCRVILVGKPKETRGRLRRRHRRQNVYLALANLGPTTIRVVSEHLSMRSSRVHESLVELLRDGYATVEQIEDDGDMKLWWSAAVPS